MYVLTNEQRILFQLLRGESLSSLDDADPGALFELFRQHRLFPVSGPVRELLPSRERERWKEVVAERTLHSLKLTAELTELIHSLRTNKINAFPLKGPVLAAALFRDAGQRHFGDIDLYVPENELSRTFDLLQDRGYTRVYPNPLTERQWKLYRRYKKDTGLRHPGRRIFLELHYGIHYHRLLSASSAPLLFEHPVTVRLGSSEIPAMNPEALFVYLLFHGAQHQYSRLFWLRDVDACLRRLQPDPAEVLQLVDETGLHRLLGISMLLAREFFNSPVPDSYLPFTHSRRVQRLTDLARRRILGGEQPTTGDKIRRHRYLFGLKPGWKYKLAVLVSILQRWRIRTFHGGH